MYGLDFPKRVIYQFSQTGDSRIYKSGIYNLNNLEKLSTTYQVGILLVQQVFFKIISEREYC
jgi:hypothetical protein